MIAALPRPDFPPAVTLRDGRVVTFGPLTAGARDVIQDAVGRMSPETSRHRFFTVRHALSERELEQLTHVDGRDRFAIGASVRTPEGRVEGVGVARFARLAGEPSVAEMAIVVMDAFQRQGIGKRLLHALARAALARGIDRLRGTVLNDNDAMIALLRNHAPGLVRFDVGDELEIEVLLDRRRATLA